MKANETIQNVSTFFARAGRLLSNGVPLITALELSAADDIHQPGFRKMVRKICRSLEYGESLSQSMREFSLFNEPLLGVVAQAEEKGILDEQLLRLADSLIRGDFPLGDLPVDEELDDTASAEQENTITQLVDNLIRKACLAKASDLHIDPGQEKSQVRFRIDGVLHATADILSKSQHLAVVSRIKIMAGLDPAEKKLPQDGRIILTLPEAKDKQPLRFDLRVSICPYYYGEKVVIRFLSKEKFPYSLDDIMSGETLETARRWLKRPYGIILVTGPTGSGKTTTLYLLLLELARKAALNILSIEDPVEYLLPGVNQMQVIPSIGLTFNAAMMSMMRQDPDVICVGEVRDPETAKMIFKIAQTGHLVLTQLHTSDSLSTIRLLGELGLPTHAFGHLLIGSISQRLIRKLCPDCKKIVSQEELDQIPAIYRKSSDQLYKSVGCDKCSMTGYLGRAALYEVFESSHDYWTSQQLEAMLSARPVAVDRPNSPFFKEALKLLKTGLTSWSEVDRISSF